MLVSLASYRYKDVYDLSLASGCYHNYWEISHCSARKHSLLMTGTQIMAVVTGCNEGRRALTAVVSGRSKLAFSNCTAWITYHPFSPASVLNVAS